MFLDENGQFARVDIETGEILFEESSPETRAIEKQSVMDDFDTQASVAKVAFDENEPENDGTANARRWLKGLSGNYCNNL